MPVSPESPPFRHQSSWGAAAAPLHPMPMPAAAATAAAAAAAGRRRAAAGSRASPSSALYLPAISWLGMERRRSNPKRRRLVLEREDTTHQPSACLCAALDRGVRVVGATRSGRGAPLGFCVAIAALRCSTQTTQLKFPPTAYPVPRIIHALPRSFSLPPTAYMMSMLDHIPSSCPDDAWVCEAALAALAHTDSAPRPFACTEPGCFQRFKRKFTLKEHIKTHTGEKPFACPVASCGKTFTTSGNLARHKRLHPWLKPLICHVESCRRSFSSEEKLDAHVKSHFDGSRSHRCSHPGCGKDFSTAGNLTRHIKQQHLQEVTPAPLLITVTLDKASPPKEEVMASPTGVDSGAFLEWPGSPPPLDLDCQSLLPMGDPDLIEALAFLLE